MANIKKHLDNIKGALFGKDVRSSIHDGIDAINKEVESTTNRQEHLEDTFDQLVINSGNSNAEIVDARVGENGKNYTKLGDRLDAVDSQLEHNANKVNKLDYDVKDIKLVGQGALTDVDILMKRYFSNNKREFGFGVEINADGSIGSLITQNDMGHKVALYGSAQTGTTGSPYIWSLNTLAQADSGLADKCIVQGYELDVNNNQSDRYAVLDWDNGMMLGLNVTSGGAYPITTGIRVGGTSITNLPYYSLVLEGSKENAILIQGKNKSGIDLRKAEIDTGNALVINNKHKIVMYDSEDYSYNTVIRNLEGFTVLHSQGNGIMLQNKQGNKILAQLNENGEFLVGGNRVLPTLSGTTANKPATGIIGQIYFDTTKGIPLFWNGAGWVKSDGMLPQ